MIANAESAGGSPAALSRALSETDAQELFDHGVDLVGHLELDEVTRADRLSDDDVRVDGF